jgi:hypothetical protein
MALLNGNRAAHVQSEADGFPLASLDTVGGELCSCAHASLSRNADFP